MDGGREGRTIIFRDETEDVVGCRGRRGGVQDHGGGRSSSHRGQDPHLEHEGALRGREGGREGGSNGGSNEYEEGGREGGKENSLRAGLTYL